MDTTELPDEMMNQVEDAYTEIVKLSKVIKDATDRRDKLRASVMRTMETIGLEQGESLQSQRLALYAVVVQGKRGKLNRDALSRLGVPEAILAGIDRLGATFAPGAALPMPAGRGHRSRRWRGVAA